MSLTNNFINLIKNSEEAFLDRMQKEPNFKGNIDIEIDDNNDYIVFRIKDNGTGITDSKKAKELSINTLTFLWWKPSCSLDQVQLWGLF